LLSLTNSLRQNFVWLSSRTHQMKRKTKVKKKIFSVAMLAGLLVALFPTAMAPAQAAL